VEAKRLKGIAKLEKSAGKRKTIDDDKALDVVGKMADRLHVKEGVEEFVAVDTSSLRGKDNSSDYNNDSDGDNNNNRNDYNDNSSTRTHEGISSSSSNLNDQMSPLNIDPDVLLNLNKINGETSIDDKKDVSDVDSDDEIEDVSILCTYVYIYIYMHMYKYVYICMCR
jgi:hypothetical protein